MEPVSAPLTYPVQRLEDFLGRNVALLATAATDLRQLRDWRIEAVEVPHIVLCRVDAAMLAGATIAKTYETAAAVEWMLAEHSYLDGLPPAAAIGSATHDLALDRVVQCARRYAGAGADHYISLGDHPARRRVRDAA